jgi:hypothetical protein
VRSGVNGTPRSLSTDPVTTVPGISTVS